MSRFTLAGLLAWFTSFVLYGYQAITKVMERGAYAAKHVTNSVWYDLSLYNIIGPGHFSWIDDMSWVYVGKAFEYVVHVQIYALLFFFGILCFVIGMFRPD